MLKRIHELRNVGRFQDCRAGGVEFDRLTIIYGRNTYGKSTLGDIFASISTGDTTLITGRSTIPADGEPQRIRFSVIVPSSTVESEVRFEENAWTQRLPSSLGVKVFDDGFLHNNLFAARAVTRTTKENFSAYILGAQGVQQAQVIAEKKRERQQLTRDRNALERDAFGRIDGIPEFVANQPVGTREEAEARLQALRAELTALRKQREDIDTIQQRSEGRTIHWADEFSRYIAIVNEVLPQGLEGTHDAAKARVTQHIANSFREPQGAEKWIREGVTQNKGEECQFCGQALSEDAKALLDAYRQAFDAEFDQHEQMVQARLGESLKALAKSRTDPVRAILGQNIAALARYPELVGKALFDEALHRVDEATTDLGAALDQWDHVSKAAIDGVQATCDVKLRAPHTPIPTIDVRDALALEADMLRKIRDYNEAFNVCVRQLQHFKQSTNREVIDVRLAEKSLIEDEVIRNLMRINLSVQCTRYSELTTRMTELDQEIPLLEDTLRENQSDYLRRFFDSLNRWFATFGSRDFSLERVEVSRGHTPVYFLRVKYRGVDIDERDLDRVFSESDRRALALAVFWTQLQEMTDAEKMQQMVVLDDPITSFDDGRITAVHLEMVRALDSVRQVIVLSHYSNEIRSFFEKYGDTEGLRLLCLNTNAQGAHLVAADPVEFIRSEHEKARIKLTSFANGAIDMCDFGALRIFFEQELNYRFADQLARYFLSNAQLRAKIDGLADNGIISNDTKNACHRWRTTLNPSHHDWPTDDREDQRRTTQSLLNFIYNELLPQQP